MVFLIALPGFLVPESPKRGRGQMGKLEGLHSTQMAMGAWSRGAAWCYR